MSVPQNEPLVQRSPQGLQRALQQAQSRIRQLEFENKRLLQSEQERNQLRQKFGWIGKVLAVPSTIMSGNQKISLIAAVNIYESGNPDTSGLVRMVIKRDCKRYGLAASTMGDALTYCAEEIGAIYRQDVKVRDPQSGQIIATETYIGTTQITYQPNLYEVATPRENGGKREKGKGKKYQNPTPPLIYCKDCQTANIERRIDFVCMDCGQAISSTRDQLDNQGNFSRVVNLTSNIKTNEIPGGQIDLPVNSSPTEEVQPVAPPESEAAFSSEQEEIAATTISEDEQESEDQDMPTSQDGNTIDEGVLRSAAELWAELVLSPESGEKVYGEMTVDAPKKYYDVAGAVTPAVAYRHLVGNKTIAARVGRRDGQTRIALWDADNDLDWKKLEDAARLLATEGYAMLVEPSPAARGGHIETVFSEWVEARAAHQHMCQIAPVLADFKEFWLAPGVGSNNKVRLFAGFYRYQGVNRWCVLKDADGNILARNGRESAVVLLTYQTPADLIPPYQEPEPAPVIVNEIAARAIREQTSNPEQEDALDAYWQEKYGKNPFYWFKFHYSYLINEYNKRTNIADLLELEANGMMLSPSRSERTASVAEIPGENAFIDFGASAQKTGGKQDGGDAFELRVRIEARDTGKDVDQAKRDLLTADARELIKSARAEMERAARAGQRPPQWVIALMSDAGWRQYWKLRKQQTATNQQVQASSRQPEAIAPAKLDDQAQAVTETPAAESTNADQRPEDEPIPAVTTRSDLEGDQRPEVSAVPPAPPAIVTQEPEAANVPAQLAAEIGVQYVPEKPCSTCGCTVYYKLEERDMCAKCYPQKGVDDNWYERLRAYYRPPQPPERRKNKRK
jgi:hypothetical protein